MIPILGGVFVAALTFATLFWCLGRALMQPGRQRLVHGICAGLIILMMAAITNLWIVPTQIAGVALVVTAAIGALVERGWDRVFPCFATLIGAMGALALPFT